MNKTEANLEFDILYNNVSSNKAPGLTLKEKSQFLTIAQELILKAYLNPKKNKLLEGYDNSTERLIEFAGLTKNYVNIISRLGNSGFIIAISDENCKGRVTFNKRNRVDSSATTVYTDDILAIINEVIITTSGNTILLVLPLPYDDYILTLNKPYKYPLKNLAWRIINSPDEVTSLNGNLSFDLIAPYDRDISGASYRMRYVAKPKDIDITNLSKDGTDSLSVVSELLHHDIVLRAVELAIASYKGNGSDTLTIGNISSTELGVIPTNREQ